MFNGKPFGLGRKFPLSWALPDLFRAWPFLESAERAEPHFEVVYGSSLDGTFLFSPFKHLHVSLQDNMIFGLLFAPCCTYFFMVVSVDDKFPVPVTDRQENILSGMNT